MDEISKKKIKRIILDGSLQKALNEYQSLNINNTVSKDIDNLLGRLRELERKVHQGTLSFDEESKTRNKIRVAIIELIDNPPSENTREEKSKEKKYKNATIAGLTIIISVTVLILNIEKIYNIIENKSKDLEIVDVHFIESDTIDIKVRNPDNEIAVIKEVELNIKKLWTINGVSISDGDGIPSSEIYDIYIPIDTFPFTITKKIAQQVKPNEADRFQISYSLNHADQDIYEVKTYVFLSDLSILYNQDNSRKTFENIMFSIDDWGYYPDKSILNDSDNTLFDISEMRELFFSNLKIVEEIDSINAQKSPSTQSLISNYK